VRDFYASRTCESRHAHAAASAEALSRSALLPPRRLGDDTTIARVYAVKRANESITRDAMNKSRVLESLSTQIPCRVDPALTAGPRLFFPIVYDRDSRRSDQDLSHVPVRADGFSDARFSDSLCEARDKVSVVNYRATCRLSRVSTPRLMCLTMPLIPRGCGRDSLRFDISYRRVFNGSHCRRRAVGTSGRQIAANDAKERRAIVAHSLHSPSEDSRYPAITRMDE